MALPPGEIVARNTHQADNRIARPLAVANLALVHAVKIIASFRTFTKACIAGFAVACLAPSGASTTDASTLEYKVKAGYLYNFARFVEWPKTAFAGPDSPFVIGVVDANEAFSVVQSILDTRPVDGRPIAVRALTAEQINRGVHIVLVTKAAKKTPEEISAVVGTAPVLLVGETDLFAERGGSLGFTRDGETIRITLNLERALEVGLKVSSKLSSVARVVRSPRPQAAKP